jgi:hypothetical protein
MAGTTPRGALVDVPTPLMSRVYADGGLSPDATVKYDAALAKTAWARDHQRRCALNDAGREVAAAWRYTLDGMLDGQPVAVCGIRLLGNGGSGGWSLHEIVLIEQILDEATREGADIALLFQSDDSSSPLPKDFAPVPVMEVELAVTESPRYGAPMTLVRGGEDRDLAAIAAMGRVRGAQYRFHLDRSVDFIQHAIIRNRLHAGLGSPGERQVVFVIAEEGITAAAYAVISVDARGWWIEECGDRDPSGARVGALLQALIALEPSRSRPVIRAWLPPNFLPPQITIASARPAPRLLLARALSTRAQRLQFAADDVLYWRSDLL